MLIVSISLSAGNTATTKREKDMEIIVFFQNDIQLWNANGLLFTTQANALESAKYQLEGIGGNIKIFSRANGQFRRDIEVAA